MSTSSASNSKSTREIKVVILGDGGVGKSALVMQFVCHKFLEYHDPTIEDAYTHQVRIDGDSARLDILDTAGQPEFTAMREQYMRKGEGFIICYSITDRRSFEEVLTYKKLIDRVRNRDDIPILIVGNKCDLEEMRKVPSEDGLSLARKFGCPFFETSAPYRQCVDDIFHGIVREIRRKEQEQLTVVDKRSRKQNRMKRLRTFFKGLHVFRGSRSHQDS